eukprot:scaffold34931_cov175-Amphora_coffeaeformis.AAC.2
MRLFSGGLFLWLFTVLSVNENNNKSLLIVGMGGVGRLLAEQAINHFDVIFGTRRGHGEISSPTLTPLPKTRTADDTTKIRDISFEDASTVESYLASTSCRHILVTTPPLLLYGNNPEVDTTTTTGTTNKDPPARLSEMLPFAQIIPQYMGLSSSSSSLTKGNQVPPLIGVLSTTGVYGDHNGEWVTESSPCYCPENSNAAAYLQWEQAWKEFGRKHSYRIRVFRCAGIYGASRSSLHTICKKGIEIKTKEPNRKNNDGILSSTTKPFWTNRIHESDLVAAVLASMLQDELMLSTTTTTSDFEVYNLADDLPEPRQVVFAHAQELLASCKIDIPVRGAAPTTSIQTKRSVRRSQENKRISNRKMRQHLLPQLRFPTYKEGLQDILDRPNAPWSSCLPKKSEKGSE